MSEAALTSLERALKKIRDREAFTLGWRVISCTAYDGSEAGFYYTQGQAIPNYPMPAIPAVVDIEPTYVVWFEWQGNEETGDTLKCVHFYP